MGHVFSITDGTTTVTLTQANGFLDLAYDNSTADFKTVSNGDEVEITETLEVSVRGSSGPNMQALIHSIESMLLLAAIRKDDPSAPKVFFQMQVDQDTNVNRAEIIEGQFKPNHSIDVWFSNVAPYNLSITRRAWEGPRVELLLASATSTTPATGGKPITNAANNWLQIASGVVSGVLPTPVELQITNTSGSSIGFVNYYLATNAFSDPTNFTAHIEGESKTTGGTATSLASCSGGQYDAITFGAAGTAEWTFTLSSALMQAARGRRFRIMARFAAWAGSASIYVQPELRDSGNLPLAVSEEIKLGSNGSYFVDLGALRLPNGNSTVAWAGMVLAIKLRVTAACEVDLDYLQLYPTNSFQKIRQRAAELIANSGVVTFNNTEQALYANSSPIYSPQAGILKVFPNVAQRIYVLVDEGTSSNVARTFSVKAFIRPRFLSV